MTEQKITVPITNNYGKVETKNIDGELDCIIINSPNDAEVLIESSNNFVVLKTREIKRGVTYIPIRVKAIGSDYRANPTYTEKFKLNENLVIQFGTFGSLKGASENIQVILRWTK